MSDKEKVQQILTKYTISELVEYHIEAVDRINKAIEYIKNNSAIKMGAYGIPVIKQNDLLDILRGENNENE